MMRMKNIRLFLLCAMLCALCVAPASAPEYTVAPPDDYTFGRPTSEDTIYEERAPMWIEANIPPSSRLPSAVLPATFPAVVRL